MKTFGLSVALVIGLVVLWQSGSAPAVVHGQQPQRLVLDTGMVNVGLNQMLRVTAANGQNPNSVRFRRVVYAPETCNGQGVCHHPISSQTVSTPITLAPGEAASAEFPTTVAGEAVHYFVMTNSRDIHVNAEIIDTGTGATTAVWTGREMW